MDPSDSELITACIAGDQQAWNTLVARYAQLVYGTALRRGLDADRADDVFQEVFLIAYRQLYGLQHHEALAAWLITITRRECSRVLQASRADDPLSDTLADEDADISAEVRRWDLHQAIEQAMRELDPRCRAIVQALFLDTPQATYEELSRRLGIPVGSIGPIRARCLHKLETMLKRAGF